MDTDTKVILGIIVVVGIFISGMLLFESGRQTKVLECLRTGASPSECAQVMK